MSEKLIPLTSLTIAGTKFRCKASDIAPLKPGEIILFRREPNNEFDANAIACYAYINDGPRHVGYIPATLAKWFAPLIDNGLQFQAKVLTVNPPKLTITIGVQWKKEN